MGNEMIEGQIAATIKRLDEIAEFGDDWDSHGAKRIDPVVIKAAKWYIETHCRDVKPAISVSPTVAGDIQLKWRGRDAETTVLINAATAVVNIWFDEWPDGAEPMKMTVDVPFLGDDGEFERVISQFLEVMPGGTERQDFSDGNVLLSCGCVQVSVNAWNGRVPTANVIIDENFEDFNEAIRQITPALWLAAQMKQGGGS